MLIMRATEGSKGITKILYYLFLAYTVCAVLYTANYFYHTYTSEKTNPHKTTPPSNDLGINVQYDSGKDAIKWGGMQDVMTEEFFLSKVFAESLQPTQVIPYYFRAQGTPQKEDITITTLITANRFPVFDRLVNHYKGPISVTIHVNDAPNKRNALLAQLNDMYYSNPLMTKHVDVHLVIDKFDRQFNMWRNVAKFFARTDYVMMLDVDFYLCTNFREKILNDERLMNMLRTKNAGIVIPAFEYVNQADGYVYEKFPKTKTELLKQVQEGRLDMFHAFWWRGHGSTNYTRFYEADQPYKVAQYQHHYEPYVIFPKDSPWCDERFIGYGANKAACLFELYLSGVDYWIMPDDFLIHQSHEYLENARKMERKYNKKLYDHFREELCFRYARNFINSGVWTTSVTNNLKTECNKIRGFNQAIKYFSSLES